MSNTTDAVGGVIGLAAAGLFFIVMSGMLDGLETTRSIDFSFWGRIYIVTAVLLGVATVVILAKSILE